MRKLLLAAAAVGALALPAAASAHHDYYNVTLSGSPWSGTNATGGPNEALDCGQATSLSPGDTKYVANVPAPSKFGLSVAVDFVHYHPAWSDDFATGAETRYFYSAQYRTGLATRRVWWQAGPGWPYQKRVKFVNDSATNGTARVVVIRANC